ncbi:hypothetical protein HII17_02625 [Thalassotalea sp. M1531]|uniref:Uncharacterized protein n=1 Tax=Thalassotalea algicola TaxID=2716224 RepID=A0A7Y0L9Q8_9GAMM|nr:hypothetical protein [Thalassotalea algicola]NMP30446.1 hypothetical protein [Thalassotalea algicola]
MINKALTEYTRGDLVYSKESGLYRHNYQQDVQLVLCESENLSSITNAIEKNYAVLAVVNVNWQSQFVEQNLQRLKISANETQKKALKVVVYQIESPIYLRTIDNRYNVSLPENLTSLLSKQCVLYTTSLEQFFYSAGLIAGPKVLQEIISLKITSPVEYDVGDMAGSKGWVDFNEMFQVANWCSDWAVMRNAEYLPDDFWGNDKDVDILCANLSDFINATNAEAKNLSDANFRVKIDNQMVDVDARVVGDDYYDQAWQRQMLKAKRIENTVPWLSKEDYFYSLFYHARVHKQSVKAVYIERLQALANELSINFSHDVLYSNTLSAKLLDEFFKQNNYFITYPNDYACYENINRSVVNRSDCVTNQGVPWQFVVRRLRHDIFIFACKLAPRDLKDTIKRLLK